MTKAHSKAIKHDQDAIPQVGSKIGDERREFGPADRAYDSEAEVNAKLAKQRHPAHLNRQGQAEN